MERMIEILKKFDYTESEAKVYISLLNNGMQSGYEVSKTSGVPRSRVYNTLEKLVNRGIVMTCPDNKTTLYKAEPVSRIGDLIQANVTNGIQELTLEAEKFQQPIHDEQMWNLSGYQSILTKVKEMIQEARSELMIQIWSEELIPEIEQILLEKEKNIQVLVILYDPYKLYETNLKQVYEHGFEDRSLQEVGSRWITVVADQKQMIYATIYNSENASASFTHNRNMVFFAKEYVTHDAYCLRLIRSLSNEVAEAFGSHMEGVRDIFTIQK